MQETKDLISSTNSQSNYLKRRIEEVEFVMHKSHKRNFLFSDIEKRLGALENKVTSSVTFNSSQFEQIKFHHSLLFEKVQILEGQQVVRIEI